MGLSGLVPWLLSGLAFKVMATDEDGKLAYEDATHIYWAAFLALLDRGGTDNVCEMCIRDRSKPK